MLFGPTTLVVDGPQSLEMIKLVGKALKMRKSCGPSNLMEYPQHDWGDTTG